MDEARLKKVANGEKKNGNSPAGGLRTQNGNTAFHRYSDEEFQHRLQIRQMDNRIEIDMIANLISDKRYDEAMIRLDRLKYENPKWVSPLILKGTVLNTIGEHEMAVKEFLEAITIKPDAIKARHLLAIAYKDLGMHREAEKTISEAVEICPESAFGIYLHATILVKLGELDRAASEFRKAIVILPDAPNRYGYGQVDMVEACAHAGHWNLAMQAWNATVTKYPQYAYDNTSTAIRIFMKCKNFHLALECIEFALKLRQDDGYLHNEKGRALAFLGNWEAALKSYDKAVELGRTNWFAYHNRARCLFDLGRYAEAIADYEKSLDIWPNAGGYYGLALAMFEQDAKANSGRIDALLRIAAELEPNNPRYCQTTESLETRKNKNETRTLFREYAANGKKNGGEDARKYPRWQGKSGNGRD